MVKKRCLFLGGGGGLLGSMGLRLFTYMVVFFFNGNLLGKFTSAMDPMDYFHLFLLKTLTFRAHVGVKVGPF